MRYKTIRGFTIPELMITLGVVAIILSTAVPSVSNTIKDNRLATRVNDVITDIHFARSEAAKRNVRVILCRSKDPNASTPKCNTDETIEYKSIWSWGYLIFADDGTAANTVYDAGTDELLRRGQPASSGVKMTTNDTWNKNLEFNPNGSTHEGGSTGVMKIYDDREISHGRKIEVPPSGSPRMIDCTVSSC